MEILTNTNDGGRDLPLKIRQVTGKIEMAGPLIQFGKGSILLLRPITILLTQDPNALICKESMTLYLVNRQAECFLLPIGYFLTISYYTRYCRDIIIEIKYAVEKNLTI